MHGKHGTCRCQGHQRCTCRANSHAHRPATHSTTQAGAAEGEEPGSTHPRAFSSGGSSGYDGVCPKTSSTLAVRWGGWRRARLRIRSKLGCTRAGTQLGRTPGRGCQGCLAFSRLQHSGHLLVNPNDALSRPCPPHVGTPAPCRPPAAAPPPPATRCPPRSSPMGCCPSPLQVCVQVGRAGDLGGSLGDALIAVARGQHRSMCRDGAALARGRIAWQAGGPLLPTLQVVHEDASERLQLIRLLLCIVRHR